MSADADSTPVARLPGRLVLVGGSVSRSQSARFQNAALRAAHIPLTYELLSVSAEALDATLVTLRADDAAGNVTIPHKEMVAARCARLTPLAQRCGAVNTFWHEDGLLFGDNTDVRGVDVVARALLRDRMAGAHVALIGAGGAAAAVLAAVEGWGGASARVYNRNMPRAERLVARFPAIATAVSSIAEVLAGATLVINATPSGTRDDDPFPVDIAQLPAGAAVFDLIHHPTETRWVRAARAAGHWASDGRAMLLEQGALAFERWFGVAPDRAAMWASMR